MSQLDHTPHDEFTEDEIRLEDVLKALEISWRAILAGALLTPLLLMGGVKALGKYAAEATLSNTCIQQDFEEKEKGLECALTFGRWRMLTENLPGLAGQWAAEIEGRGENPRPLAWLASPPWWEKNVVPVYGLSQAETKKFPLMDEKLKAESTRISQIKLTSSDRRVERAWEGLDWTLSFLRNGATYLEFRTLFDGYQSEVAVLSSSFAGDKVRSEVEAGYLRTRLKEFEGLMERDKDLGGHDEVRVDVGTVDASFLPLRTQANALKVTLYGLEEKLRRIQDREASVDVLTAFLSPAHSIMGDRYRGQMAKALSQALLASLEGLESAQPTASLARQETLARIRGEIVRIQGRYGAQLPEVSRRIEPPKLSLPALAGAGLGGAFLGFLWAFGGYKLREYRKPAKRI